MNDEIKRTISMLSTINTNINTMNQNIHDMTENMHVMNKNIDSINSNTNNMDNNISKINLKINKEGQHEILLDRLHKIESLLEDISTRLEKTNSRLENTNLRLEKVENTLQIVNKSTKNMDEHINFVENVYTVVKKPFVSLLGFYYNKNIEKTLEHFDVKKRIKSSESDPPIEYEIVETFSETEN
jgi:chromosome segregation ATPase